MTITTSSTTALHTGAQPLTRQRSDDVAALPAALRSEWIKVRSLRSTPGLLAAVVVIGVLLSWILATFVKIDPDTDLPFNIGETFIFSTWLTTVLATIVGTLMFTSEVQHGTIATAVAAQPARWVSAQRSADFPPLTTWEQPPRRHVIGLDRYRFRGIARPTDARASDADPLRPRAGRRPRRSGCGVRR